MNNENLGTYITVRVSSEEKTEISNMAKSEGLTISAFSRYLIFLGIKNRNREVNKNE